MSVKNKSRKNPGAKKILLVEDDPFQIMMYSEELLSYGHKVRVAKNMKETLSLLKEEPVDLVFMDLLLGNENGMDIIEELKKQEETKSIAVVVLSNYAKPEVKKRCDEIGVLGYLLKSDFVPKEIAGMVEKFV